MGATVSALLIYGEKLSLCCAAVSLFCCVTFTLIAILGLGIGLGYNHCYVDMKTRAIYVPAHYKYHDSPRASRLSAMAYMAKKLSDAEEVEEVLNGDYDLRHRGSHVSNQILEITDATSNYEASSTRSVVNSNTDSDDYEFRKSQEKIRPKEELIPVADLNLIDLITKLKDSANNYSIQVIRH